MGFRQQATTGSSRCERGRFLLAQAYRHKGPGVWVAGLGGLGQDQLVLDRQIDDTNNTDGRRQPRHASWAFSSSQPIPG